MKKIFQTAVIMLALSISGIAAAQAPGLACTPSSGTAFTGQDVTFTATGGNNSYLWSVPEITVSNSAPVNAKLRMNYGTVGTKQATVQSAGQTATCTVQIIPAVTGNLACTTATPNPRVGQATVFNASGGVLSGTTTTSYLWTTNPPITLTNNAGTQLVMYYGAPGTYSVTVSNGTQSATCSAVVTTTGTGTGTVTPGIPDTGRAEAGNGTILGIAAFVVIAGASLLLLKRAKNV